MTPTHRIILESIHAHWPDGIRPDYATYEELAAMTNLSIDQIERAMFLLSRVGYLRRYQGRAVPARSGNWRPSTAALQAIREGAH